MIPMTPVLFHFAFRRSDAHVDRCLRLYVCVGCISMVGWDLVKVISMVLHVHRSQTHSLSVLLITLHRELALTQIRARDRGTQMHCARDQKAESTKEVTCSSRGQITLISVDVALNPLLRSMHSLCYSTNRFGERMLLTPVARLSPKCSIAARPSLGLLRLSRLRGTGAPTLGAIPAVACPLAVALLVMAMNVLVGG